MILLPQGRKILLIAASLFIATFSLVFFVSTGPHGTETSHLKASVFESFFDHGKTAETPESALPSIVLDGSGHVISTSGTFSTTFGYTSGDLVGRPFFHLVSSPDLATFAGDYARAVSGGKIAVNEGPYHIIANNDQQHVVLITFTPGDDQKHGKTVTLTLKDISESVQSKQRENAEEAAPKGTPIRDIQNASGEKNRIIVDKTG